MAFQPQFRAAVVAAVVAASRFLRWVCACREAWEEMEFAVERVVFVRDGWSYVVGLVDISECLLDPVPVVSASDSGSSAAFSFGTAIPGAAAGIERSRISRTACTASLLLAF